MINFFKKLFGPKTEADTSENPPSENTQRENTTPESNLGTDDIVHTIKSKLQAAPRPALDVNLQEILEIDDVTISKLGGDAFIPAGGMVPKDSRDHDMYLLAQLNFAELPEFDEAGLYPEKGLLQFWIAEDDLYGSDLDTYISQRDYRVIFHPNFDAIALAAGHIHKFTEVETETPFEDQQPRKMAFTPKTHHFTTRDYRSDAIIEAYYDKLTPEQEDAIYETDDSFGHLIGGYPSFTQTDPRGYMETIRDYELLLQLDSADGMMWGDCGVGNFFIHPDDLRKRDFSKVMYSYDCH